MPLTGNMMLFMPLSSGSFVQVSSSKQNIILFYSFKIALSVFAAKIVFVFGKIALDLFDLGLVSSGKLSVIASWVLYILKELEIEADEKKTTNKGITEGRGGET